MDKDYDQLSSEDEGEFMKTEPPEVNHSIDTTVNATSPIEEQQNLNNVCAEINNIPNPSTHQKHSSLNFSNNPHYNSNQAALNLQQNKTITSASIKHEDVMVISDDESNPTQTKKKVRKASNIKHTCLLCNANLGNRVTAKSHIEQHPVEELYLRKDQLFAKLIEHTLKLSTDDNYKCQLCDAAMVGRSSVMYHYCAHLGDFDVFLDKTMNRRFKALQKDILDAMPIPVALTHGYKPRKKISGNPRPKYVKGMYDRPCALCEGFYVSAAQIYTHLVRCHSEKVYKECDVCGKVLAKNFENHMRTHIELTCERCGKVFTNKANLTKHISTHPDERPHRCEYCEKRFKNKSNFTKHIKIHTGERNYRCTFCEKAFTQSNTLRKHLNYCPTKAAQEKLQKGDENLQPGNENSQSGSTKSKNGNAKSKSGDKKSKSDDEISPSADKTLQSSIEKSQKSDDTLSSDVEKAPEDNEKSQSNNKKLRSSVRKSQVNYKELPSDDEEAPSAKSNDKESPSADKQLQMTVEKSADDDLPLDSNGLDDEISPSGVEKSKSHNNESPSADNQLQITPEKSADDNLPLDNEKSPSGDEQLQSNVENLQNGDEISQLAIKDEIIDNHYNDDDQSSSEEQDEFLAILSESSSKDNKFKCEICCKTYATKSKLSSHIKIHKNKTAVCNQCPATFVFPSQLKIHLLTHSTAKYINCEICGKSVASSYYPSHKNSHNHNRFFCKTCGKMFLRKAVLHRHQRLHAENSSYHCDLCKASFDSKRSMDEHNLLKPCEELYCGLCNLMFQEPSFLLEHQASKHTKTELKKECINENLTTSIDKTYCCDQCDASFPNKRYLNGHMKVHKKETYKCDECDSYFAQKSYLISHKKRHGKKNFMCTICDKAFFRKTELKEHMNSHTREYYNKCEFCDAMYSQKSALYKHKKKHTIENYVNKYTHNV